MHLMVPEFAIYYLDLVSLLIGAIGVLSIIYATFYTVYKVLKIEFTPGKRFHNYEHTKRTFIQKIILALDFFVAADLIRLSIVAGVDEIMSIAIIVAIRTILSWSLGREIHLHKE